MTHSNNICSTKRGAEIQGHSRDVQIMAMCGIVVARQFPEFNMQVASMHKCPKPAHSQPSCGCWQLQSIPIHKTLIVTGDSPAAGLPTATVRVYLALLLLVLLLLLLLLSSQPPQNSPTVYLVLLLLRCCCCCCCSAAGLPNVICSVFSAAAAAAAAAQLSDCPRLNCLMAFMCSTHPQCTWCCCRAS
jgi:hypothetical protein